MFKASRENVIGIGKVKIYQTNEVNEVPVLHYLVIKEDDGSFSAICLELRIDANSKDLEDLKEMIALDIDDYVNKNFEYAESKQEAYDNLINLTQIDKDDDMINNWNVYRYCQYVLASKGIKTDIIMQLKDKITKLTERLANIQKVTPPYDNEYKEFVA